MPSKGERLLVYVDEGDKFRWKLLDGNNRKTAVSGESFFDEGSAVRAAHQVRPDLAVWVDGRLVKAEPYEEQNEEPDRSDFTEQP